MNPFEPEPIVFTFKALERMQTEVPYYIKGLTRKKNRKCNNAKRPKKRKKS